MTEKDIEDFFIHKLELLKYSYRPDIHDYEALKANFRAHFDALNAVKLTDSEFSRLLAQIISPDVFASAKHLRERNSFERDDGTPLHYTLVNIKDWCKNTFEVINQLRMNTESSYHRYDVLLLLNGVPVVQIELKSHQITPRRAMQQIIEYKNDAGNGYNKTLLCFLQLFIVSNQIDTWYFANNNLRHFHFNADERFLPLYQFADENNKKITHLDAFADKFLAKCTLGEMISHYMVLVASEQKLLMMRPYQIYAVKAIVACIHQHCGNGYIWHTTGSGKTLTSFKAATLLKSNPDIDKCLFVVDRKDLDRQTREEFNKFQAGCVEENTNTESLVSRLLSDDYADKVIVTTIQKLGIALDDEGTTQKGKKRHYRERLKALQDKRVVFIFDECHRSQFGENHQAIKEFFPNSQLFGFTGTPIFEENASYQQIEGQQASYKTTQAIFQHQLHSYTITHAIEDRNVLRFHVNYYKPEGNPPKKAGEGLAKRAIVEAILAKHAAATNDCRFNAIFATASIDDAIEYYALFKELQADAKPLNIACIFSPPLTSGDKAQNSNISTLVNDLLQEKEDNKHNPEQKKSALMAIIADYNARYGTNYSINEFDLYYQDVQKRIKDQQYPNSDLSHSQKIDIVIVVDMLLTGFDSKYLNTLYVDKNLKYHSLIQAFSRTNRVLNDTKPYGNILDFRQQQEEVDTAINLFSGQASRAAQEIWLVDKAPVVIEKYQTAVQALESFMQKNDLAVAPSEVANIKGDKARANFVNLFKEIQRIKTQLAQYTDLTEENTATIEQILPTEQLQGFKRSYLDVAQRLRELQGKQDESVAPEVEQLDFEFVLFASAVIDYDYIMTLIARYSQESPEKQKMSREQLIDLIQSDAKFMDERDEIAAYIGTLEMGKSLSVEAIHAGYAQFKADNFARVLRDMARQHGLDAVALQDFVAGVLRRMVFDGEQLSELFAPLDLGWKLRGQREQALMVDLIPFLHQCAKGREISGLKIYEQ
ncbi:type I site-specific deoxyribonuclease, HsdR family [Beggiatoa alba B18LD]|uniref:Type I restriction enzyme endonuclease subunit n=1 Tax=Beggiatoa alba B18LD TaxID=395493 RepID=I3CBT8_9GAMM|nr:type I restriction endonuclease subunit R [Beggiatoa alba]EIJ41081.1 type I site-specific deoxyribonuclease, HsdR family [Beggiatoa alba B18LD]